MAATSDGGFPGGVRPLTRLAVIGLLLVASRHGRRGLGRQLTQHPLAYQLHALVMQALG
jgi:hypothetical protein